MYRRNLILYLALSLIVCPLMGCINMPAPALTVPNANQVNRVVVTDQEIITRTRNPSAVSKIIVDPEKIAQILDFLRSHNDGWYTRMDTFPSSRFTIAFYQDDRHMLVVWFSNGWLGGRNGGQESRDNREKNLSPEETETFKRLLEIN
jgi:hypothetical protein